MTIRRILAKALEIIEGILLWSVFFVLPGLLETFVNYLFR